MNKIKGALAVGLLRLLGLLPFGVIYSLGTLIGTAIWLLNGRGIKVTKANIAMCYPDLSIDEQNKLSKQTTIETGRTVLEAASCWSKSQQNFLDRIAKIEGEQLLIDAMNSDKGLIIISSHLGDIEALLPFVKQHGTIALLYRPWKITAVEKYIANQRGRYANLFPTNRQGITAFDEVLKNNGIVALAGDPEPRLDKGQFIPFFGVPALTANYVIELKQRYNANAIAAHITRDENHLFNVFIEHFDDRINSSDIGTALGSMNQTIEQRVRNTPTHYQWSYKKFKHRPDGSKNYKF